MTTSNAVVLKSNRKLRELAIEEMEDLICQENVGCLRVLAKKQLHDVEEIKGGCRPERLCHMLVGKFNAELEELIQGSGIFDPPIIFKHNLAKPEG